MGLMSRVKLGAAARLQPATANNQTAFLSMLLRVSRSAEVYRECPVRSQSRLQTGDAPACGVVHRIDDGGDSGDADLSNAVRTKRRPRVGNVGSYEVDVRVVRLYRHVLLRQQRVHNAAGAVIEHGPLCERHRNTHDDAAKKLRHSGL
jgi:hypothetical protein